MNVATMVEFLEARIAEDEAAAQAALTLRGSGTDHPSGHPLDPARALAECAAKRAILERRHLLDQSTADDEWTWGYSAGIYDALRAIAAAYADHPDYARLQ